MASQAHSSISALCCTILQPQTSSLGVSMGIPPHPCTRLLTNTSLVISFPLHSWGRYTIKKDLCCPLSPISPLNVTEQREKSQHFGERREAVITLERHQALKRRWLERTDQRPSAYRVYLCQRTKLELKTSSDENFLYSTGLNLGKSPTELKLEQSQLQSQLDPNPKKEQEQLLFHFPGDLISDVQGER